MDLLALRNLGIAAVTAMFIGVSTFSATASEKDADAVLSPEPQFGTGVPWAEMDLAPEIDWDAALEATLDAARDWTGLLRFPPTFGDENADFLNSGGGLPGPIDHAGRVQDAPLEEDGDL